MISVAGKNRHFDWDVNVVKMLETEPAPTLRTARSMTSLQDTLWEMSLSLSHAMGFASFGFSGLPIDWGAAVTHDWSPIPGDSN